MSSYTIGEIVVWLLVTAVIGFVLGWLVRELQMRAGRQTVVEPAPAAEVPLPEPEPTPEPEPSPKEPEPEPATPEPPLIKGKKSSMIYHTPSSGSYARTKADVWFHTEDEAVAAGFRKPKNS